MTSLTIIGRQSSTVFFKALLCTAGPVGTVGGIEGNVYGFNPTTGIMGPICGDYWTYKNVKFLLIRYFNIKYLVTRDRKLYRLA